MKSEARKSEDSIANFHTNRAAAPKGEDGLSALDYKAHPHSMKHVTPLGQSQ